MKKYVKKIAFFAHCSALTAFSKYGKIITLIANNRRGIIYEKI